jgi:hypothetical protein
MALDRKHWTMRYLQLAVPVLIVVVTLLLLTRRGGAATDQEQRSGSDTGIFVFILVIGAVVAAIAFFAIGELLS